MILIENRDAKLKFLEGGRKVSWRSLSQCPKWIAIGVRSPPNTIESKGFIAKY